MRSSMEGGRAPHMYLPSSPTKNISRRVALTRLGLFACAAIQPCRGHAICVKVGLFTVFRYYNAKAEYVAFHSRDYYLSKV